MREYYKYEGNQKMKMNTKMKINSKWIWHYKIPHFCHNAIKHRAQNQASKLEFYTEEPILVILVAP